MVDCVKTMICYNAYKCMHVEYTLQKVPFPLKRTERRMKKVTIEPGCISCTTCQFTAPEVFEVVGTSRVKEGADIEKHLEKVKEAVRLCPVQVIQLHTDDDKESE